MQIRKNGENYILAEEKGPPLVTTAHALLAKVTEEKPAVFDDIINSFCFLTINHTNLFYF